LDLTIDENLGTSACSSVMDYCTRTQTFSGVEPVCQQTYSEGYDDYCSAAMECSREIELTNGVSISSHEWRDVWCEGHDDWVCECWAGNASMRIELAGEQETPELCNDMLGICASDALAPTGPVACQPRSQWADSDYCDVNLECAHSGTYEGQAVSIFNYQYAGCRRASESTWDCWCGTSGSEPFQLVSDGGWNACTQVADVCAL
jgi:hypothetical protein